MRAIVITSSMIVSGMVKYSLTNIQFRAQVIKSLSHKWTSDELDKLVPCLLHRSKQVLHFNSVSTRSPRWRDMQLQYHRCVLFCTCRLKGQSGRELFALQKDVIE